MAEPLTRCGFHAAAAAVLVPGAAMSADPLPTPPAGPPADRDYPPPKMTPKRKKPVLSATLIEDFVVFAHYDFDMVKVLLAKEPAVVNATVDWGGGDWESGLGGAAHIGRRDIAEYLLDHGARIDVFAAAMLGHLDVVKGLLTAHPKLIDAKGPHGFSLHFHAKAGGAPAKPVYDYLLTLKPEPPGPLPPAPPKKPG